MHRDARLRLTLLGGTLGAEQLGTRVPGTAAWTVHEVFAHLVGLAADVAAGRLEGAPGAEWHVAERRRRAVRELLAEWDIVGLVTEARLAGQMRGPKPALDISCHELICTRRWASRIGC
jgi:Mycothiol maleylpyruvate isomerase N-terminal domain